MAKTPAISRSRAARGGPAGFCQLDMDRLYHAPGGSVKIFPPRFAEGLERRGHSPLTRARVL